MAKKHFMSKLIRMHKSNKEDEQFTDLYDIFHEKQIESLYVDLMFDNGRLPCVFGVCER